jgi:hypothetical protein
MLAFRVAPTTVIIWQYLWKQCPLLLKFESHSWLGLLNNSRFGDYLHLIYQNKFEVQITTDSEFLLVLSPINKIYNEDQLRDIDLRSVVFSWLSCSPHISKTCHEDQLHGINLRSVAFSWYTPPSIRFTMNVHLKYCVSTIFFCFVLCISCDWFILYHY